APGSPHLTQTVRSSFSRDSDKGNLLLLDPIGCGPDRYGQFRRRDHDFEKLGRHGTECSTRGSDGLDAIQSPVMDRAPLDTLTAHVRGNRLRSPSARPFPNHPSTTSATRRSSPSIAIGSADSASIPAEYRRPGPGYRMAAYRTTRRPSLSRIASR